MNVDFEYRPMPVHAPFHSCSTYERAMFGAFGSGKTYAIVAEAIAWCLEQPGIRGLIARKTTPELRDTVEPIFFEMLPPELYKAGLQRRTGGHCESFTFPNGSKILFRSLDDWNKHRSLNLGFIAYDEANEIDEETYLGMKSRVRQRDPTSEGKKYGATEITRRGIWLATNPAGEDWLWERFVNEKTKQPNTAYFKSTSLDNPYLPVEYVRGLLDYPEAWVRRYVLCTFDNFGGQIYEEWNWDDHVVKADPSWFERGSVFWMGMDPGTELPTAGLWVYKDQATRTLIGVAEYQENGLAAAAHAQQWRKIEAQLKGSVQWRVADPSVEMRDRGTNMTLSDQYRRLGFNFRLGPLRHAQRIPMLGQLIHLKRFKLTTDCPQTYEQIRNYRWEDLTPQMKRKGADPSEKPLKRNDHLVDCAQYLSSRYVQPMKDALPRGPQSFSEEVHAAIKKNIRQKRLNRGGQHDLGHLLV